MLIEQTMDKLVGLELPGMIAALQEWLDNPERPTMTPTDLVGMLADAQWLHRENRKLTTRLRQARFRHSACIEDIDYRHPRGLKKPRLQELSSSRWVALRQSVILTDKTGTGKSYLACALGQKACRDGFGVIYERTSRLFDELAQARADGTYLAVLRRIAKASVLILDDFGLERLGAPERRALLDVLEDRYDVSSTVITSQLEPKQWHAIIGDETAADSICDRLVHNAHRIQLDGESIRKSLSWFSVNVTASPPRIGRGKESPHGEEEPSSPPSRGEARDPAGACRRSQARVRGLREARDPAEPVLLLAAPALRERSDGVRAVVSDSLVADQQQAERIERLKAKLARKDAVIAEISEDLEQLEKELGEP